jgi:hypothetical protein
VGNSILSITEFVQGNSTCTRVVNPDLRQPPDHNGFDALVAS